MSKLWDGEAEQGVLGALLLGAAPVEVVQMKALLPEPACFAKAANQQNYQAMMGLLERGVPLDPLTVRDEFRRLGWEPDVDDLAQLADAVPTAANLLFHAGMVREHWLRRKLAEEGHKAIQRAETRSVRVEDAYSETVNGLVSAALPLQTHHSLSGLLQPALERLEGSGGSLLDAGAISTGLPALDEYLGGLAPKRMVVLAARPNIGKTSLALHMACAAAQTGPVWFTSLEMGPEELAERLVLAEAKVQRRRGTTYTDREVGAMLDAAGRLAKLDIQFDESCLTPGALRLALQARIAAGKKPVLVVVDYVQLMRWPTKTSGKVEEVTYLTGSLKRDIAKGLDLPLLALSQLSRKSVSGDTPRAPQQSDLRDSGSLEQDADQVLMLHYCGPERGVGTDSQWGDAERTECYIRKNRHGAAGHLDLRHHRPSGQWAEWMPTPSPELL